MSDSKISVMLNKLQTILLKINMAVAIKAENGTDKPIPLIFLGKTNKFKAVQTEGDGTYKWEIVNGNNKVSIAAGTDTQQVVELNADKLSKDTKDISLKVTYTYKGFDVSKTLKITVIELDIKEENRRDDPVPYIANGRTMKYTCVSKPAGIDLDDNGVGLNWQITGGKGSLKGGSTGQTVEVKADSVSGGRKDSALTVTGTISGNDSQAELKLTIFELAISEDTDKSTIYKVWDLSLEDHPDVCKAVFKVRLSEPSDLKKKDKQAIRSHQVFKGKLVDVDNGNNEIEDLTCRKVTDEEYEVEWDGKKGRGKGDFKKYQIKLKEEFYGKEGLATEIKIARLGVTEISFKNSYLLKFYDDLWSSISNNYSTVNDNIPDPQWKLTNLDDSQPPLSKEELSFSTDRYCYPVCYKMGSQIEFEIKLGGKNYASGDKVRVTVGAKDKSKYDSSDNEDKGKGDRASFSGKAANKLPDSIGKQDHYQLFFYFSYDHGGGNWKDLGVQKTSNHRIYTTLDAPVDPWSADGTGGTSRLWVSVLEKLCGCWVSGLTTKDAAASEITRKVFHSGVIYETGNGKTNYAELDHSYLKAFLNFIDNKSSLYHRGELVNCTDCATMVTSLANALGCELWSSRFGDDFYCHKIISIGFSHWAYPFSNTAGTAGGFGYHEIAWKGGCGDTDEVFDACLKTADDPVASPGTNAIFITNMVYNTYEPKLVHPSFLASTRPDPGKMKRRPVL